MKGLKIFSVIFLLVVGGAGGYGWYLYSSMKETASQIYEPREKKKSDLREEEVSVDKQDPISILILGVDERKGDMGRSDTMVILTVNPRTNSSLMFSIPRDTRTEIPGKGIQDKINHAYAFGGAPMAVETVENFLKVPIDYYIKMNMEGFADVIDTLDGVEVNNPFAFDYKGIPFPEGPIHLNGKEALMYTRMRYEDPRGDLGRNDRQRQVLKAVITKAARPSILMDLSSLLKSLGTNVKTNISPEELQQMAVDYRSATQQMETLQVMGKGTKIDGVYYYQVSEAERERIGQKMRGTLGLN